jgi:hypothetical protein
MALKGLYFVVGLSVIIQMALVDELLIAKFATKRSLAWVCPQMRLEIPSFFELFQTFKVGAQQKPDLAVNSCNPCDDVADFRVKKRGRKKL